MINFSLSNLGAILNILGTVIVAISIGTNPSDGSSPQIGGDKGLKDIATVNYPRWFKVGLLLIILGFLFQLEI